MDDWAYVFYANLKGINSLQEMLWYDSRPNAAWLYMLGFRILGFKPFAWHIMSLFIHWGIVVLLWLLIRAIWPNRKIEAVQVSLLFAVFPFFMTQPFPIAYTHVWFGFLTFNFSLLLMVWAIKTNPYRKVIFTLLAIILEAAHLFTGEYFSGGEFIRVPILWVLVSREELFFTKKGGKFFLNWLPYMLTIGMFAYWRTVIFENPPGITRNSPVILQQLFSEPLKAISFLINASLGDALTVLVTSMQKITEARLFRIDSPFVLFRLGITFIGFGLAFFYLSKLTTTDPKVKDDWKPGSLAIGIVGILTGGIPFWLVGRSIGEIKNFISASRVGIPSIFGAVVLMFIFLDWLIMERNKKLFITSIILALAINFHLDNAKEFQYSWEKQTRFSQQLLWRAPRIVTGTSILTDQEILGRMGEYAVSFSINTTYQPGNIQTPPYWYFPFLYTNPNVDELLQGTPFEYSKHSMNFSGNSNQMLLLSFNPEMKRCLWILSPYDSNLRLISDDMRRLSAGSDIRLIQEAWATKQTLPESIYGKQSTRTWCYYFEKADLARQYSQWDEIARLWEESQSIGERADNGYEYIPFIEGYAHLEDWEQVLLLTKFAIRITNGLEPSLCTAINRLEKSTPATITKDKAIINLKSILNCANY